MLALLAILDWATRRVLAWRLSNTLTVIEKTVAAIERGAKATANGIERGAKSTAQGVERGVQATGRALNKVSEKFGISKSSDG